MMYYNCTTMMSLMNDSGVNNDILEQFTGLQTVVIYICVGVLAFVTFTGNLLVMVSFVVNRKLRTMNNYFLTSLSVADAAIGLVSMPLYIVYVLKGYWPFGSLLCDLWLSVDYSMSHSSVLHIMAICIDRYLSLTRPLTYKAKRTSRKVFSILILIWFVSIIIWVPWIFAIPFIEGGRTVPETNCYIQFLYSNDYLTIITHILAFWLPVIVMVSFYQRVYHATRKHKAFRASHVQRIHTIHKDVIKTSSGERSVTVERRRSCRKINAVKDKDKAAKILSAILLAFIATWTPYQVNVIISCFCPNCVPPAVYNFGYWLCYINSTVNPFLYALCNAKFRWTFLGLLMCNFRHPKSNASSLAQSNDTGLPT